MAFSADMCGSSEQSVVAVHEEWFCLPGIHRSGVMRMCSAPTQGCRSTAPAWCETMTTHFATARERTCPYARLPHHSAYPNANPAGDNLCKAFSLRTPPGFIITTSAIDGANTSVVPTATIALGVTTAQTVPNCKAEVANAIASSMRLSLITQTTQPLTNETNVVLNDCAVLRVRPARPAAALAGAAWRVAEQGSAGGGAV